MRFLEPFGREGVIYSNIFFQILCKSTAILLYEYEEYVKKLLKSTCLPSLSSLAFTLSITHNTRTIRAQYTHNTRTINGQ